MRPVSEYSRRTPLVVLCAFALLAVAMTTGGAALVDGGDLPEIVASQNTTSYLQPGSDADDRRWLGRQGVEPSVAITASAQALHGRQERTAFDRRYFDAEDADERARLIRQRTRDLEQRVAAVTAAHREARRAHTDGTATASATLRRLARVDAAATKANRLRNLLENRSALATPRQPYQRTLDNLAVDLSSVRGPVTRQIRQTLSGSIDGRPIYLETVGETGLVAATTDGQRYYREAFDATAREEGGPNRFASGSEIGIGVAYSRAAELYPWIFRNNVAPPPARGFGNTSVYLITVDHSQGSMATYLDGTTETVFREIQQKRLAAVPTESLGVATDDGLRLTVNGSHRSGPVEIRLRRAADRAPVDGEIRVNGRVVGTTGADGRLWTVQPSAGFTVNATRGDDAVAVTAT